ncbi:hypothetical protein B0H13DRAFT_2425143 [Mycena leptocephala]|nr:hypothetical protein B0H13DRAFT_2425143 [Mycena leptocephala]
MAEKVHKAGKQKKDTVVPDDGGEEIPQEPQKKKHKKNKTGYPDPEDDPSLSEQARKALAYAFLQIRKPTKWKFSKARQNWLIRNIWSTTIPEPYLALTIQYLSNVKGGVRETLIKDCQTVLSASLASDTTETVSESKAHQAAEPDQLKHARARALLDTLNTPESEVPK